MEGYILKEYMDMYEEEFLFVIIEKVGDIMSGEKTLKCMMTINEKTILRYQLEVLQQLGIKETKIIVESEHLPILQEEVKKSETKVNVDFFEISRDNLFGNENAIKDGSALREFINNNKSEEIFNKYKNIVCIPGELLFDVKTMSEFINKHRLTESYMTLLTTVMKDKNNQTRDFLLVNEKGNIFSMKYCKAEGGSERITIPFDYLLQYPTLSLTDEIQTMKTFIVRSVVLKRMKVKEEATINAARKSDASKPKTKYTPSVERTSIHKDIIPYIVKLLISKDGQDIKQPTINDLYNHFPSSFEPPCLYFNQTTNKTLLVTKDTIDDLTKRMKSGHLKFY